LHACSPNYQSTKYRFDLIGILEVKWGNGGAEVADDYILFYGKWIVNDQLELEYFILERIISAVN
jgi:hypothetical protein